MRRKKQTNIEVENLVITDATSEGMGLARLENEVIFVVGAIPGDVVNAVIYRKKKNFSEARIAKIITPSTDRQQPICKHFGYCGGCKWQQMSYKTQLFYKSKQVTDALTRIGKIDLPLPLPIMGCENPYFYRNKMEYTFTNKAWLPPEEFAALAPETKQTGLGFHVPARFDAVVHIENCYLQAEPANAIRNFVHQMAEQNNWSYFNVKTKEGWLRNLVLRNNIKGEWMVVVIVAFANDLALRFLLEELGNNFKQITSLFYSINQKANDSLSDQVMVHFAGEKYLIEQFENVKYQISPQSFFQTNSAQAENLYKLIRKMANIQPNELVYDLYTGTGSIALFVAKDAARVVGIEYVPQAIADAKANAALNGIINCSFFAGDMAMVLNDEFLAENGQPDVVITDPPRAGMHQNVVEMLLRILPKRIVYVSCNPSTQARDLQLLEVAYQVIKYQAVDMFPQTSHVENIVLLHKKIK